MLLKQFQVTYGDGYGLCETVVLSAVSKTVVLTRELARRAALEVAEHMDGVRVRSSESYGYEFHGQRSTKFWY